MPSLKVRGQTERIPMGGGLHLKKTNKEIDINGFERVVRRRVV